ncbi:hypothetical protein [Cognatishimia sp.]|uniref:hypothetical protein n=1 Tax=Cognatishimia sp. TaxID=2211648 RepID=UPI00351475A9|nr:hypothetical protein [Cognatishimia sp.]
MGEESTLWQILATFFAGSFFGTLLGPILLDEYRGFRRWLSWGNQRQKLLKKRLENAKGDGWVGIDKLARLIGESEEDTRALLITIKARGGTMRSGNEAWALIKRQPLQNPGKDVEED